jgi:hypothetical protein
VFVTAFQTTPRQSTDPDGFRQRHANPPIQMDYWHDRVVYFFFLENAVGSRRAVVETLVRHGSFSFLSSLNTGAMRVQDDHGTTMIMHYSYPE